jgi:N-acetylneuraminic acid mutarotase
MIESLPSELLHYMLSFLNSTELCIVSLLRNTYNPISEKIAERIVRTLIQKDMFHDLLDHDVIYKYSWKFILERLTRVRIYHGGGLTNGSADVCFNVESRSFSHAYKKLENPGLLFKLCWFKGLIIAFNSRDILPNVPDNSGNSTVQAYDVFTDTWTDFLPPPRRLRAAATVVFGDKLFVIGGVDKDQGNGVDSSQLYVLSGKDKKSLSWTRATSGLTTARSGHAAIAFKGKIIVVGGHSAVNDENLASVEAYDPSNNTWECLTPLLKPRYLPSLVVIDDCLYVAGGYGGICSIERYDWQSKTWEFVTRIRDKRLYCSTVAVGKVIYFFGGIDDKYQSLSTWDAYNTVTCAWESEVVTPQPLGANSHASCSRELPWTSRFTYGQSIAVPPSPLSWSSC